MNTANLQLEGLYVAVSALMDALRRKNVLTEGEIDASLAEAEMQMASDPRRSTEMSPAHVDAILFPLRYLRIANRTAAAGDSHCFCELAALVGREKPQHSMIVAKEREDIEASENADAKRSEEESRLSDR